MDERSNNEIADLVEAIYMNPDKNFGHFKGGLKEAIKRLRACKKCCPTSNYIPTKTGHYCNLRDGMGNGCSDSWWTGGNYGGALCRNPAHHDAPTRAQLDASAELEKNDE